ncbi:MAG: FAD-dependent oxidoreductase [Acidimicrobiia bacterium]|nr:FAD-dependent oxidoreductase [Acidimicrobiia bacterium]
MLVVGGGYAGLHAACAVRRCGVPVTVVDRTGQHDFVTRLAAVAGGTAPVEDASGPLGSFVDPVVVGTVVAIADGSVTMSSGRTITADAVVVTAGSAPSRPPVDGIELAHVLRSAEDAAALRGPIASASSMVVIGGGATGIQLAGAAAVAHPSLTIHLVEAAPRLLAGMPGAFSSGATRILESRNVRIHMSSSVERITERGALVDSSLLEGLVVWAGGFSALAQRYGVPTAEDGRILVDEALRVQGSQRTFAAGDIAAHRDRNDHPLPMSAQIAVRAGSAAGRNAACAALGEPTEVVDLRQIGWVLDLGGRRGLAQVGPINLTAPGADLIPPILHDAIDLKDLLDVGGVHALRYASSSVRSLLTWPFAVWPRPSAPPAMIDHGS